MSNVDDFDCGPQSDESSDALLYAMEMEWLADEAAGAREAEVENDYEQTPDAEKSQMWDDLKAEIRRNGTSWPLRELN